jgi:hypothetical protein
LLRIDPAGHLFGVRVNVWVSLIAIVGGAAILFRPTKKPRSEESTSESGSELRDV